MRSGGGESFWGLVRAMGGGSECVGGGSECVGGAKCVWVVVSTFECWRVHACGEHVWVVASMFRWW